MSQLTITPEFLQALELIDGSSQHVFVTGKAGTGKSTLLQHFRETTTKTIAVLAPTGVAALNVQGQTIHSFLKFRPDTTPESADRSKPSSSQAKLYASLDTIVIDEVSMLRADLLDSIDMFLRKHGPQKGKFFGGIQMVFFGDLYQLPPVVTSTERQLFATQYQGPHFFNAKVIQDIALYNAELTTIYRQQEAEFIDILNAIRNNSATAHQLTTLNQRCNPTTTSDGAITLATTNALADTVNQQHLDALPGRYFTWKAIASGTFAEKDAPAAPELTLKHDAQVMLLTNDPKGRWVNGSIGTVHAILDLPDEETPVIEVQLSDGRFVQVQPFKWETYKHEFDESTGSVEPHTVGTFTQYPLRLAWAVTIHKSQGKTFDKVIIDLGRGTFSAGQLYVALSRCRTLEGITLRQPVQSRHIMSDPSIVTFLHSFKDGLRKTGQDSLWGDDWGL